MKTFILSLLFIISLGAPASAHFLLNLNVRIFHVEHVEDGLDVYIRMPTPYLLAGLVGPERADGLPEPAPYTSNMIEDGLLMHYIDEAQVFTDPKGLGKIAADSIELSVTEQNLSAIVKDVRLYPVGKEPGFATLKEAKDAFVNHDIWPQGTKKTYVGDTVTDVILHYEGAEIESYTLSGTVNPGLEGQENTANLILDYTPEGTKVFRARGLLENPVRISSSSALSPIFTFIKEGIRHILEGLDHVLFVLCLILGASGLYSLLARVTGFSIGHTVTLILGFFGFVPAGAWFVPTVETGIALSIVYAAALALLAKDKQKQAEVQMFLIAIGIGLLHGLGFSFMLHEILKVGSPNLWQSLLAFNVGVEIGQLFIVLLSWPLFRLLTKYKPRTWRFTRMAIALTCSAISLYWAGERTLMIIQSF